MTISNSIVERCLSWQPLFVFYGILQLGYLNLRKGRKPNEFFRTGDEKNPEIQSDE